MEKPKQRVSQQKLNDLMKPYKGEEFDAQEWINSCEQLMPHLIAEIVWFRTMEKAAPKTKILTVDQLTGRSGN